MIISLLLLWCRFFVLKHGCEHSACYICVLCRWCKWIPCSDPIYDSFFINFNFALPMQSTIPLARKYKSLRKSEIINQKWFLITYLMRKYVPLISLFFWKESSYQLCRLISLLFLLLIKNYIIEWFLIWSFENSLQLNITFNYYRKLTTEFNCSKVFISVLQWLKTVKNTRPKFE